VASYVEIFTKYKVQTSAVTLNVALDLMLTWCNCQQLHDSFIPRF